MLTMRKINVFIVPGGYGFTFPADVLFIHDRSASVNIAHHGGISFRIVATHSCAQPGTQRYTCCDSRINIYKHNDTHYKTLRRRPWAQNCISKSMKTVISEIRHTRKDKCRTRIAILCLGFSTQTTNHSSEHVGNPDRKRTSHIFTSALSSLFPCRYFYL